MLKSCTALRHIIIVDWKEGTWNDWGVGYKRGGRSKAVQGLEAYVRVLGGGLGRNRRGAEASSETAQVRRAQRVEKEEPRLRPPLLVELLEKRNYRDKKL